MTLSQTPSFWCVEFVENLTSPLRRVAVGGSCTPAAGVVQWLLAVAITWFFLHVANCVNWIGSAVADLSYHVVLANRQTVAEELVPSCYC